MLKTFKAFFITILLCCVWNSLLAQNYAIQGKITDRQTGEPLVGAIVLITPGNYGGSVNMNGEFIVRNIPAGRYTIKASMISYEAISRSITVNQDMVIDFKLAQSSVLAKEVIVEVNRARERETPVAFSDIDSKVIETRLHGQDAPLLVMGTPGVYAYSSDGVGNGESKLLVRGFSQNYVQVLINGIPTNDPESNAVYWSNWGAVAGTAASIQIQRGAGSSLYGAGAFGGSFNIVTQDALPKPYYGLTASIGSPMNTNFGIDVNSGLIDNQFAFTFKFSRKVAEGSKLSGRYEGLNYYLSAAYFPKENQTIKFILHGGPQKHGYSYSANIAYYKKYGYDGNGAPVLPRDVVNQLPTDPTTGLANYGLTDNSRELADDKYVNLAHNFYHKPQFELHYSYDISDRTALQATAFYSIGRGGGSSLSGAGTMFSVNSSTGIVTDRFGPEGLINDVDIARTSYLGTANSSQRISYSFHQQAGILANIATQPADFLKLTGGMEFRYWDANHPGHYTNLFGKDSVTFSYRYVANDGSFNSFNRALVRGDLIGPESDYLGNIFGWELAGNNDPAFKSQYRNYDGTTPQYTIFLQGNWLFGDLNLMTSLQFVNYTYKLHENMPSESAIGRPAPANINAEGPVGDKFYMRSTTGQYYEFDLVRENRSNSFIQPKVGANYNLSDNINVFANYAYVQRFVDLGVYYNQGRVNTDVEDEKSNQFELGLGYTSDYFVGKVNGYHTLWQNKSTRLRDPSMSGQPGYDYQGYRNELIGTSRHMGIEFAGTLKLNELLRGLEMNLSFTMMDNTWLEVLDMVKYDNGARRVYNASALDANGVVKPLYFDELENTHVASGPQTMAMVGLLYNLSDLYFTLNMNYFTRDYLLDGETYMAVDGEFYTNEVDAECFKSVYENQLPSRALFDFGVGYRFNFSGVRGNVSAQVLNIFDTKFLASSDSYGVIPGMLRSFRLNLSIGF
jgi:outer membrane receptor protein involved in Fe transport